MTENQISAACPWQRHFLSVLEGATDKLFLLDLDGTIWSDILVILNEEFGPVDDAGDKLWKKYDRAYKVEHTMTNGSHLEAEYRDLLKQKTLDELLAWLKENHRLIAGAADFIAMLQDNGITPVAITNGAREIAGPMLAHHGLNLPFVSNWLNFDGPSGAFSGMGFLHNAEDAIRKGDLVRLAHSKGYVIVGCAGDSRGDICLSEATAALNGIVLASGAGGGLSVWCAQQSHPEGILVADQCLTFSDFNEVKAAVLERISQL